MSFTRQTPSLRPTAIALAVANTLFVTPSAAEEPIRTLPAIEVTDSGASAEEARGQMPPVTSDGRLTVGKRTSIVEIEEQPVIVNNNLRQTFAKLPGLLVSEQQVPSIFNVNYRGLGDPHESEFVAFFENGLPLGSDPVGYSTIYYLPPTQRVDRVEFIRGGSSLLYGPQLGPAINFVTTRADASLLGIHYATEHAGGTDGLYSTFNEFSFGDGKWGVYAEFDHRQADGERDNADYSVLGGRMSVAYQASSDTRLGLDFYAYNSDSGEAGRLTLTQFNADPTQTRRRADRVFIDKYFGAATLDHQFGDYGTLHAKVFGGYQDRFSRRQNNTGTSTNLDRREFQTVGADIRHVLPWGAGHTLTAGYTVYHDDAPRTRFTNPNIFSSAEVTPAFDQDLSITYNALFAENAFQFGRFGIAPALRWEHIDYGVDEARESRTGPTGLLDFDRQIEALLLGVGFTFDVTPTVQLYANASESYRPPTFDDLANPTSNNFIPGSTDTTSGRNYEVGVRGSPLVGLVFDLAAFHIDVEDRVESQFPSVNEELRVNSGDARHRGVEFQVSYDFLAQQQSGDGLEVFVNGAYLDAEITASNTAALIGNTPLYAPDYLVRAGAVYTWQERLKLAITATSVAEQFWQDSNAAGNVGTALIPDYQIVDVSGEFKVTEAWTAFGGINNISDERYFSRIRGNTGTTHTAGNNNGSGIEPAADRTFYAGVRYAM